MSFKSKLVNKPKEIDDIVKEKQNLISLVENRENQSLPFALIKISINNKFLPLSLESYYQKILPELDSLRKKDGSKYSKNYIFAVKSALASKNLFEKRENNLYEINIKNCINYVKKIKAKENKNISFLGKKRQMTKNLVVRKFEKYIHTFQLLNDLSETFPKKSEENSKIKINFNKYKTSVDLMEKNMSLDKISGMLITFKYFKNILKKFLYDKKNTIDYEKKINLNKQISGLKDGFDLIQSCIKNIVNSKNIDSEN